MYNDDDFRAAVKAGVLDEQSWCMFRRHIDETRHTQAADEENFRLLSGFNDIFVTVAALLFLISCAWLSGLMGKSLGLGGGWTGLGLSVFCATPENWYTACHLRCWPTSWGCWGFANGIDASGSP